MTNPSAGWYPDPAPESAPGRLRYWDGDRWTEHVHDPTPEPAPTPGPYPGSYPQYPQYPQAAAQQYGVAPGPARKTTPDGVPLAGWWWRVLALVLDGLIQVPLTLLFVLPVLAGQWDEIKQWFDDVRYAADHNLSSPPRPDIFDITTGPGIALVLSALAAGLVYQLVFLRLTQATPGKLIVGLRIRRREAPGLPWSAILPRVGFVIGVSLLGQLPTFGILFILLALLDDLWPLWDSKNQALHDKVAGTNVVRPEHAPVTVAGASPPPRW